MAFSTTRTARQVAPRSSRPRQIHNDIRLPLQGVQPGDIIISAKYAFCLSAIPSIEATEHCSHPTQAPQYAMVSPTRDTYEAFVLKVLDDSLPIRCSSIVRDLGFTVVNVTHGYQSFGKDTTLFCVTYEVKDCTASMSDTTPDKHSLFCKSFGTHLESLYSIVRSVQQEHQEMSRSSSGDLRRHVNAPPFRSAFTADQFALYFADFDPATNQRVTIVCPHATPQCVGSVYSQMATAPREGAWPAHPTQCIRGTCIAISVQFVLVNPKKKGSSMLTISAQLVEPNATVVNTSGGLDDQSHFVTEAFCQGLIQPDGETFCYDVVSDGQEFEKAKGFLVLQNVQLLTIEETRPNEFKLEFAFIADHFKVTVRYHKQGQHYCGYKLQATPRKGEDKEVFNIAWVKKIGHSEVHANTFTSVHNKGTARRNIPATPPSHPQTVTQSVEHLYEEQANALEQILKTVASSKLPSPPTTPSNDGETLSGDV